MKYIEVLREMDRCLQNESTGAPKEFARKLGMSERHLYNYLKFLRELGGEIDYNQFRQSYSYAKNSRLVIGVYSEN